MFERILVHSDSSGERLRAALALAPDASIAEVRAPNLKPGELLDDLVLTAEEMRADLVVTGASNRTLARRLAMMAPCSVLVVPENTVPDLKQVAVGVDFSVQSADALRIGCALVERSGGVCRAIAVACADDPWLEWGEDRRLAESHLAEFLDQVVPGGRVSWCIEDIVHSAASIGEAFLALPHAIEGADIASTITMAAERCGAGLLLMGTRGRTPAASILIGSVTEKVIQMTGSPTLAVKLHGAKLGLMAGILERLRMPQPGLAVN